jgi:signal transduction histidine kinase
MHTVFRHGLEFGLATVYGTIDRHKGPITLDSEVGKGTLFRITLLAGRVDT